MRLLDSSCRVALPVLNARPTCLGILMGVGALFCGEAQANIWDRLVWNDLEMQIVIVPKPVDGFYAKTPFFDNAIALLAPDVVPIRYGNTYATTAAYTQRTARWTPIVYCDCTSTTYNIGNEHRQPAPVPLPASGWLLLAGLAILRGVLS